MSKKRTINSQRTVDIRENTKKNFNGNYVRVK